MKTSGSVNALFPQVVINLKIKFSSTPWCFCDKGLDRGRDCDDRPVYIATDCHVARLNKVT